MNTALIITTYNRPELLERCFMSVRNMSAMPNLIIIIDDASSDKETHRLIGEFNTSCDVIKLLKPENKGINDSLLQACDIAFRRCNVVINLDADAIVKPDFISRMLSLKQRFKRRIISGFNCNSHRNPVIEEGMDYVARKHCNGINMCFDYYQFTHIIKPALVKDGNWDFNSTHGVPFIISKPSLVQHIGHSYSSMGHKGGDYAQDFKSLRLPSVTLFGIDSYDVRGIKLAVERSSFDIEFGDTVLITEDLFTKGATRDVRIKDYSRFMIERLNEYIKTDYVITVHADGYVLNASAWDDVFFKYDYIGAKWWYKDGMNVGNGGFSFRSKRLLEACAQLAANGEIKEFHPEDDVICRKIRGVLEDRFKIVFAPEDVADKFSIECWGGDKRYKGSFGFHGKNLDFNTLPLHLRPYEKVVDKKMTALEMWRNRPKAQPVIRYQSRYKNK